MIILYIIGIYMIIPLLINLGFYLKHKLVPVFYYNLWYIGCVIIFIVAFLIIMFYRLGVTFKVLLLLSLLLICLGISIYSLKESIKKGLKLRLNKRLLSEGNKIKIYKLYFKQYRPIRRYYLCYYTGTYTDSKGCNHKFKSEDYFDSTYNLFINKKFKKKTNVIIYVDPNDENKYYYRIEDLN